MTRQEQQQQFIRWAEAYDAMLWKVARSFAVGADQDDLRQELLLALWKALPAFRGDCKESTFAYRVAYNCALAWNRKTRPREVPIEDGVPAPLGNNKALRIEQLHAYIRALEPLDRTLLLLYLDEISYRDMADILGISESNVGVRLNRAKKRLASQMREVASA